MATRQQIAQALRGFQVVWNIGAMQGNLAGASAAFQMAMQGVGIIYQDNAGSRQRSPTVHGLHIGELLDMVRTVVVFTNPAAFLYQKFLTKVGQMISVMEDDSESESDSD